MPRRRWQRPRDYAVFEPDGWRGVRGAGRLRFEIGARAACDRMGSEEAKAEAVTGQPFGSAIARRSARSSRRLRRVRCVDAA
jgi:hypothetical protein